MCGHGEDIQVSQLLLQVQRPRNFSTVVGVFFPMAVIFVVIAIVIYHQSARRKQRRVQRLPPIKDAKLHRQKCRPQKMSQMKKLHVSDLPTEEQEPPPDVLITEPNFLPPPIPISLDRMQKSEATTKPGSMIRW